MTLRDTGCPARRDGREEYDVVVRGGDVVLPDRVARCDIAIRYGVIADVVEVAAKTGAGGHLADAAGRVIDATGCVVLPGLIDPHTHMGIPIKDATSADDFTTGSLAAAFGGVTTILDFTVQESGQSLREALDVRLGLAGGRCHVDYGVHNNVTDHSVFARGQIIGPSADPIGDLIDEGFDSFKVFTTYREAGMMSSWDQLRAVLGPIAAHGGVLMVHAEDDGILAAAGAMHRDDDHRAAIFHARSRPARAEAEAIRRVASLAGECDAALYIVHLSSELGLHAGLEARRRGVRVHLETCPHYLVLDESAYRREDGHLYITTPPLRRPDSCAALWQAVRDGDIDTIGTDHCPFTRAQKAGGDGAYWNTPNGLPGVEDRLALLYTYGVAEGRIDLVRLADLLARNPARIFGIDDRKGAIRVGHDGDLVVWDPRVERVAGPGHGSADWSPYQGMRLVGQVTHTLLRGRVLVEGERFVGGPPGGKLVRARR